MVESARDLTRTVLAVVCMAILIVSAAWIVRPFVSASVWAASIVISTWPLLIRLQRRLGNRRGLATAAMTVALVLVVLIPITVSVAVLIANTQEIVTRVNSQKTVNIPPPPEWISRIPVYGEKLSSEWLRFSEDAATLSAAAAPYVRRFVEWSAARVSDVGSMMLQFLLTIIISAVLYVNGEVAANGLRRFARRLAGPNGDRATILAFNTIRGVARGVVVTAVMQSMVAGTGLLITSVPRAGLLSAAILICCLAQLGPALIMIPAVIWKFYIGDTLLAFVLLFFAVVSGGMDNFVRPFLIRKAGADLPTLLIMAGVIGGIVAFGIMGIFVGPVVLAVSYVLIREWVDTEPEAATRVAAGD